MTILYIRYHLRGRSAPALEDVYDYSGVLLHQAVLKAPYGRSIRFHYDKANNQLYLYQVELTEDEEEMVICYRAVLK